jgi:hypothetical protein
MRYIAKGLFVLAGVGLLSACAALVGLGEDYYDCGSSDCRDAQSVQDASSPPVDASKDASVDTSPPEEDAACKATLADGGNGVENRLDWASFKFTELDGGPRLTVEPSGLVVRDQATGLRWQRYASTKDFAWKSPKDSGIEGAQEYCLDLRLDGEAGWKVPNKAELISLLDYEREPAFIDKTAFPDAGANPNFNYWTSSAIGDGGQVWVVSFIDGYFTQSIWEPTNVFQNPVRCVK